MVYLFLHGFTGSGASWASFLTKAHLDPSEVLTPDLPGHGANLPDDPAAYTMAAAAADLIRQIDGQNPVHLYGYSMGGRLALYLALTYPERFASLTLESASPGLKTEQERSARRAADNALADRIEQNGLEAFVAEWERLPLWDSQKKTLTPAQRDALHTQRLKNNPRGLANSLRGMGTGVQPSLWERLPDLQPPLQLITGLHDSKFCAINEEMAGMRSRFFRHVVDHAGHAVHLEQPDEVWKVWDDFIDVTTNFPSTGGMEFF